MSEVKEYALPSYSECGKQKWDDTVRVSKDYSYDEKILRYCVAWATTITGIIHGCAVGVLAFAWSYGEQLKRWDCEDASKSSVLNSSIIVIQGGKATVCENCKGEDMLITFAGPGGSRRECRLCGYEQTGIDVVVDSRQSDDPPDTREDADDDNCNRCGCLLTWKYNADGIKLCGDCNQRDEEYRDDMLRDAIGEEAFDEILKERETAKASIDVIEYEYFDLAGEAPF
jgi:Zn ribbon nucleic-acid-binding protein